MWKKIHIVAWLCLAAWIPAVFVGIVIDMDAESAGKMIGVLFLSWIALLIVSLVVRHNDAEVKAKREMKAKKKQEAIERLQEEREKQKELEFERKRIEEEREQKAWEQKLYDNWPVSAVVVSTQDKTRTKSGLGSAVVGGIIAGPVGAVVGASVGKKTVVTGQKLTFSVKYKSGRTGIEIVEVGSERFERLSALLVK